MKDQQLVFDIVQDIPSTYTGIYSMHKYWSKKPYNIIKNFILKYTNENDIVLDPFLGSGVTIVEAIFTNRKGIGIDINPSAILIANQMLVKLSIEELNKQFKILENACKDRINSLYTVNRDGKNYIGTHFLWNDENLTEVWYKNGNYKGSIIDKPTEQDIKFAKSFTYKTIPYYYPKQNFFHNPRINAYRENKIYELFTPRNLLALSFLLDEINKIENPDIRDIFRFCFTASVGQASKMVFVVKSRGKMRGNLNNDKRKEVGSWVIGYWTPKENFEINVWNCFENRWRKIIKAKKEQMELSYAVNKTVEFDELANTFYNLILINDSAQNAMSKIPDNSIDYIITDPPHGNRLPYLELSMMWNEWLGYNVDYENEIVISDSKDRKKDKNNYYESLRIVFSEIERVLKPNHYFSLIFNSLDDETWINLIKDISRLKLDLESINTIGYSANSVVQDNREVSLKTDFIFTFKKNTDKTNTNIKICSCKDQKEDFITKISECIIASNGNGRETYEILNHLVIEFLKQGKFFKLSEVIYILREKFDKKQNRWFVRRY